MNYIDIILAIPLLWAIYMGFTKGFIIEITSLIALFLGVYGAIHFSYYISDSMKLSSAYSPLISFAITFLIIVIVWVASKFPFHPETQKIMRSSIL